MLLNELSTAVGAACFAQNARLQQEREAVSALASKHANEAELFKSSLLSQIGTMVGQFVAAQQQGINSISKSADSALSTAGKGKTISGLWRACYNTYSRACRFERDASGRGRATAATAQGRRRARRRCD